MKAIFRLSLIALTLMTLTNPTVAEPLNQTQLPNDITWVAHLDLDNLHDSQIGQFLFEQAQQFNLDQKLADFKNIWAFNPLTDIQSVTIFGHGTSCENSTVLMRGQFQKQQIIDSLEKQKEYEPYTYARFILHSWFAPKACGQSPGKTVFGCFYDDNLIVMGADPDRVQTILETLDGDLENISNDSPAFPHLDQLAPDAIFIAATNDPNPIAENAKPRAAILQQAKNLTLALHETQDDLNLTAVLTAKSQQDAIVINQALLGLKALAILNAEKHPDFAQLIQYINISTTNDIVTTTFNCPLQQTADLIKKHWHKHHDPNTNQ